MNPTGASQFNQARIEWAIRLRYSPMPELDMGYLASQLNAFRIGEMRVVGKTWEVMMERDAELAVNADKRYSDASGLEWQVVSDGSPDGDRHAESLTYFYKNLKATEALEQDDVGKCDHLIYQLMSAHSYRYSAHEMLLRIDNPAAREVTAEFRHTPIWFFESRRGYLGYLKHIFDMYGQPCLEGEWLTGVGLGWMRPLSMAFAMKHFPLRDWLVFCTRYGSGFMEGITDAQKDSPEWVQASEALEALANDGVVLHNQGVTFKFLDQPAKNALPFHPIIEMIDRLYAKCYRGVDLATGSRGASGGGEPGQGGAKNPVGSSVQKEESGIFLLRDAKWVTGIFNERIDRPIIRYLYNQEPRAFFALTPPIEDMTTEDLQSLQALVPMGLKVALQEVYKRFRWKMPAAGEEVLTPAALAAPQGEDPENETGNTPPANPAPNPKPKQNGAVNGNGKVPAASGQESEAERDTMPARAADNQPIGAGADPKRNVQTADNRMPNPQVDASGFWSRAGLKARGADGQVLPMPSLGYAIPNADQAKREMAAAVSHDIAPLIERLAKITAINDDAIFEQKLRGLLAEWDQLAKDIQTDPAAQHVLKQIVAQGLIRGLDAKGAKPS